MIRTLFGTDGIRGTANADPMTAEVALRVAMAAGAKLRHDGDHHTVVIGKDTRLSGYMLENAMTAGFLAVGMDVFLVGPMPTPAVAMLTRSLRADLGVVISASHNPYQDNGIKLFGPDGYKLSDQVEAEIEHLMSNGIESHWAAPDRIGRARRLEDAGGRYIESVKGSLPRSLRLDGLKVVIDCAHGAAYRVAPRVLWELGADVVEIGTRPNGVNINEGCGAVATEAMCKAVVEHGADVGCALDGDADRLIVADETGHRVDGDQLMALIATDQHAKDRLAGGGVVATVMSNLGLERYLAGIGLHLRRTAVGDRYVVETMLAEGYNLGGEQSGHIILSDHATTGDGLVAALQVLAVLKQAGGPASQVFRLFQPVPQVLRNVRYASRPGQPTPLDTAAVGDAVAAAEADLGETGRILIRKSGTEPLIRVMGEGDDKAKVDAAVNLIVDAVTRTAGAA